MTKAEIVSKVARETTLTKSQAESAVNAVYGAIEESILNDGSIRFDGLFAVKIVERAERNGRNPKTGKAIKIAAHKGLKVALLGKLKGLLNE